MNLVYSTRACSVGSVHGLSYKESSEGIEKYVGIFGKSNAHLSITWYMILVFLLFFRDGLHRCGLSMGTRCIFSWGCKLQ